MIQSYRELRVWQAAMDVVEAVYRSTAGFPAHEIYGLMAQMRRAAVSIPSNIAEGYARSYRREYVQFLALAQGSLAELDTQLEIALRLGYLSDAKELQEQLDSLGKQLRRLRESLAPRVKPQTLDPRPQTQAPAP